MLFDKLIENLNSIPDGERPNWNEFFLAHAALASSRSTCIRRKVGAVIVTQDMHIVSSGYNGAPPRCQHCKDLGCERQKLDVPSGQRHEICRAVHAEQNAICAAAKSNGGVNGCTIYIYGGSPCIICAKMIVSVGIKKVIYYGSYPDTASLSLLAEGGVEVRQYELPKKQEETSELNQTQC